MRIDTFEDRLLAQSAVGSAILRGALVRHPQSCAICAKLGRMVGAVRPHWSIHYHHWSYLPEHWLDVKPLCGSCHQRVHAGTIPDPTSGATWERTPYAPIDPVVAASAAVDARRREAARVVARDGVCPEVLRWPTLHGFVQIERSRLVGRLP